MWSIKTFFGISEKETNNSDSTSEDNNVQNHYTEVEIQQGLNYFQFSCQYIKSHRNDDYRCQLAYPNGGMTCPDPKQVQKLRSVGKELAKIVGKKILGGTFNLTKISMPIRACVPKTALNNSVGSYNIVPYFLNRAAHTDDHLQRFRLVLVAQLSTSYYINMFLKPLNPILGQTLQAELQDGTKLYAQQISHHPPVSYFLICGPNNAYKFYGHYNFAITPYLNSLKLQNLGKSTVQFKDGQKIEFSFPFTEFASTFVGTSRCQAKGKCLFKDHKNQYHCEVQYGNVPDKPSDYFESAIHIKGKKKDKVFGTYCGYIEINGQRYWDGRDIKPFPIKFCQKSLQSDWRKRTDRILLEQQKMDQAQQEKQRLQELQRKDAKLRLQKHPVKK